MATVFNTQVGNEKYCLQFETDNKEHYMLMQSAARRCIDHAHMTNADRIRNMNDKELKKFICSMFKCEFCDFELGERCGLLNWLQMPAEDDE